MCDAPDTWASTPLKSKEEQQKELKELEQKDPQAAMKLAAEMLVSETVADWRRGKDFSGVIKVLREATR